MADHPHHQALRRAVERAGNNQSRFAREVGTSQQMVSYWLANGKALPGELVLSAERAGFGSRHDLRPDLYPADVIGADDGLLSRAGRIARVSAWPAGRGAGGVRRLLGRRGRQASDEARLGSNVAQPAEGADPA